MNHDILKISNILLSYFSLGFDIIFAFMEYSRIVILKFLNFESKSFTSLLLKKMG